MSQCRLVPEADGTHFRCDDCGEEMLAGQLDMITDIEERLTPGGIVPAGQCPHCGALAYYADGYAPSWSAQAAGERLIEQAAAATTALKKAENFIVGFEDDPMQVGIPELLEDIRAAIAGAPADPLRDAAADMLSFLRNFIDGAEIKGRWLDETGAAIDGCNDENAPPEGEEGATWEPYTELETEAWLEGMAALARDLIAKAEGRP